MFLLLSVLMVDLGHEGTDTELSGLTKMWGLFTAALTRGSSATKVSVVNTSSNFMVNLLNSHREIPNHAESHPS